MPEYMISYLGGNKPSSADEGKKHFAKYMDWLSSLGESAVSPANPLKDTSTVSPDGTITAGSTTTMSGFTIVRADSMDAAMTIAKSCPFLDIGGSLEVSELIPMPGA
ncbi:MAG TPA: YciI family protein [Burkholderiales bacterium]|nr:YciI family protein [Burkholderiales bacterium]